MLSVPRAAATPLAPTLGNPPSKRWSRQSTHAHWTQGRRCLVAGLILILTVCGWAGLSPTAQGQDPTVDAAIERLQRQAREAEEPLEQARAWISLGAVYASHRQDLTAAEAAYDEAIQRLDDSAPAAFRAEALNARGRIRMFAGKLRGALQDFDAAIALMPRDGPKHWRRGIVLYYLGQYEAGAKQFEAYQDVDDSDVENAVWRMLCQAKQLDLAQAREQLLKVGHDPRPTMKEVYDLFAGMGTADDVTAVVERLEGDPQRQAVARFYANLYLALYADAEGRTEDAAKLLAEAVKYERRHDMWHVARLHLWYTDPEQAPEGTDFRRE